MNDPADVIAEISHRERLARRGLLIGAAFILLLLGGSHLASRFTESTWGPLLWTGNLISLLLSAVASGVGIANLSTSDSFAVRFVYGLVTAAIVLVTLAYVSSALYFAGGGQFHI